ncbi:MAG: flagellar basal body-associated FliL family protein [Candidatus Latescibacterota bacterium]
MSLLRCGSGAVLLVLCACASTPPYLPDDCPLYQDAGMLRANPAGAPERHLEVAASFRVCPPEEGLAEIRRKHIELKHEMLALLSSRTLADLEDPRRVEKLQKELLRMANEKVMRRGKVTQVLITAFELR